MITDVVWLRIIIIIIIVYYAEAAHKRYTKQTQHAKKKIVKEYKNTFTLYHMDRQIAIL